MEQFVVTVCPEAGTYVEHPFTRKGLAFAYAKRKLPKNCDPQITILHRMRASEDQPWSGLNTWTFHPNGDIDHTRL